MPSPNKKVTRSADYNLIRLGPPLIATKPEIDELLAALDAAFATA